MQKANRVTNPRHLPTNTRIKIPVELLKQTPAPATVTHVKGNVRVKPEDGPYRKLAVGDVITGGETVVTGPRSFASIKLADGSVLNQQPTSKLSFGRLAAYGKTGMVSTELNLESGRLEANASKQVAPAGGFRVATPVAVAGLRGTDFRLNVSEDGKTLHGEVLEGAVGVAAQGQEVHVEAGQGTVAEAGKPPTPPRALLPKPNLEELPARIDHLPMQFTWQRDMATSAWRAQVATDHQFQSIILDDLFIAPQANWDTDPPPDGNYVLRVRGVDADGLEGLNTDHPFELDVRPLPPQLLAPAKDSRSYTLDVTLSWSAAAEAQGYVLQLSPDPTFQADVRESSLQAVNQHQETLSPGVWHWRMTSLDDQGRRHGWSSLGTFLVQPLPEAPKVEATAEPGLAHFTWSSLKGAQSYQFQLAAGPALAKTLHRGVIPETRLALELAPGKYYWRVRGLEADGQAGDWSTVSPVLLPPPPPEPISQGDNPRVADLSTRLAWRESPGALGYRLQVNKGETFAAPWLDTRVEGREYAVTVPSPGQYRWRVAALGEDQLQGPYSQPRGLLFQPPPPAPDQVAAREDNNRLYVTWRGAGQGYRLELARDPAFIGEVMGFDSTEPELKLIMPQPGQYWLRVIAYDQEGLASTPSLPLAVEIKQPFPWWLLPFLFVIP